MQQKKILIIGRSFYPILSPRSFRTTELAKEFAKNGHDVTVITHKSDEIHDLFAKEHKFIIKDLGSQKLKIINLGKSKFGIQLSRIINRILQMLFEYPDIELMLKVKKVLKNETGYDLLISIAVPYPIHWGVAWALGKNQKITKTWVADCGDPYMGCKTDSFGRLFYFKYIEKWFSRKADYIAITRKEFIDNYYSEFHHKIVEIPQGFNYDEICLSEPKGEHDYPNFAFAGNLIPGVRDPRMLLEYLITVKGNYKFILYLKRRDLVLPYVEKAKGRIEIRDYVPRKELITQLSEMDFLVNFEYDPKVQSPSKLIDYALTKRPILNITSKNFDLDAINQFLKGDYRKQFLVDNIDKYNIVNVCNSFINLVDGK